MKKFFWTIVVAATLGILMIAARWTFFNVIKGDEVLDGLVDFRAKVASDMEQGVETGTYYVRNVEKADVKNINKYIDSAYGTVESYKILAESGEYLAIQMSIVLSDNYYALRKYLYGEDIPETNPKAAELYRVVDSFITSNISDDMSDFEKEVAVHDYIVKNSCYGYPEDEMDAYTAYGILVSGTGVCDGYAESFELIMTCLGANCDMVVGSTDEGLHAWNQIELGGKWYNVDLTWDDSVPDMGDKLKHTYFNVTDQAIAESHYWESQFYNTCDSMEYNYYSKKFYLYNSFEEYTAGVRIQIGKSRVIEAAIYTEDSNFDMTFLSNYGNLGTVSYVVESMGDYKVIVVYLN